MAFLIATGDYLTPQLVGGLDGTMFGSIIVSEFGFAANWPLGAAMALTLLAVVCFCSPPSPGSQGDKVSSSEQTNRTK